MNEPLRLALQDWRSLLGSDRVLVEGDIPPHFRTDTSLGENRAAAVLKIADAKQLPGVMQAAHRHDIAVHPVSTGNNWGYGSALPSLDQSVVLDLSALNAILDFDPELGVVTLEPGVTQAMLAEFLDRHGHRHMVPVTGAGPHTGLLSNALERGYGVTPHADHFAAVTDIEAVLADGSLYRSALREAGGAELARLFKWGIGAYLNGLFTQSGFGIVTRISIALVQRPECVKVCLFSLAHDDLLEPAVDKVRSLLQSLPGTVGGINLMNRHRTLAMTAPYPGPGERGPDGLVRPEVIETLGRQYQIAPWTGFATLYGRDSVVKAAQREIRRALKGIASRLLFLSPNQANWIRRLALTLPGPLGARLQRTAATLNASLQLVQGRPNETALPLAYWRSGKTAPPNGADPARDGCGLLWYAPLVPMRVADVRRFLKFATATTTAHGMEPLITLTSQGDRLFDSTIPLLFDLQDPRAAEQAKACLQALIDGGQPLGFYPYRLHVDAMARHAERTPLAGAVLHRLKSALDPQDILAPGRYQKTWRES